MQNILKVIQEKKARLDAQRPLPADMQRNFLEWFRIELTYTSNAIEGNTLSRAQTALVVEKGITVEGKSITEHLEAINHAKAFEYIQSLESQEIANITERTILDIHSIILHGIDPSNAGRYRTVPVRIAGSTVILPNPLKVPNLMNDYIAWLHKQKRSAVDLAAEAHIRLVSIHPFTDGNGRTARLLMNLMLMQNGYPPAIIRKEDRNTYINSIEKGQLTSDFSDYYPFIFRAVERSLDIYLEALEGDKKPKATPTKLLRIGELARLTNESVPTIRYWTREGLLTIRDKTQSGYQLYGNESIDRVKEIRNLQSKKRLTIKEIKQQLE